MRPAPRILPLVGVAVVGVLAVNALAGARQLPDLLSGAQALAEEAAKPAKGKAPDQAKEEPAAATGEGKAAAASSLPPPTLKPQPICAPTAAELAKEAGLSPAELQVLQSLGERRGQLDQRESDLDAQLALLAAAEAKLDAKVNALNALKRDIQGLLSQTDQRQQTEIERLVKVFEGMKPKDAAPRLVLLDDAVRLPIAAKMKERSLAAIVAQMPPAEAKKLTEALAKRFSEAKTLAQSAAAAEQASALAPSPAPAKAKPQPAKKAPAKRARPAPARMPAPAQAQAANDPAAAAQAKGAPAPAAAAASPAKAG